MPRNQHGDFPEETIALPPGTWIPDKWGVVKYQITPTNDLIKHGTERGYHQHRNYNIPQCDPCKEAHAAEYRRRHQTARVRPVATCGTPSGYKKHIRNKEAVCDPCRVAGREYDAAQYARRKAARKEAA